jgi:hypothetical protein
MLQGIARLAIAAPRRIIAVAALVLVSMTALLGMPASADKPVVSAEFAAQRKKQPGNNAWF